MDVTAAASGLVAYAQAHDLIGPEDATWAYNRILEDVGAWGPGRVVPAGRGDYPDLDGLLSSLSRAAIERGVIADDATSEDELHMRVMGELTPRPSEVARRFDDLLAERGPQAATDYFYRLSCDVDYVRRSAIARNVRWVTPTSWGDLEVTINRSKPEKDPRAIARVLTTPAGEAYPACQLCMENEGYSGHPAASGAKEHPARQNLRIVPIILGGERWGLQYSPYAYYSEHCIAMSSEHRPMHVDGPALERLLDFVDLLPHYFVGSNADLPIVGEIGRASCRERV